MEDRELRLMAYREAWNVMEGIYQVEVRIWEDTREERKAPRSPTTNEVLVEAERVYKFLIGG